MLKTTWIALAAALATGAIGWDLQTGTGNAPVNAEARPPVPVQKIPGSAQQLPVRAEETHTGRSIDVRDFGAKGDNATDDAPAIQAAIERAAGQGGGTVRLAAGTYRLQPREGSTCGTFTGDGADGKTQWALNVPDNVTLRGEGPEATVLRVAPKGLYAVINMRAKQARIKGLGIVSDAPAPGISELWGILANRAERCVVEDCRFERLSVGVLFTGAQACRASRCQARDCTGNGLLMYAASRFSQRLECKRPHPFRRPAVSCFPSHSRFPLGDNCNDFA